MIILNECEIIGKIVYEANYFCYILNNITKNLRIIFATMKVWNSYKIYYVIVMNKKG